MGLIGGVGGVRGELGAGRNCRYSGSEGIGASGGIGGS